MSTLLLLTLFAGSIFVKVGIAGPTINVSPPTKAVLVGESFTIYVNLDNAQNLYGYEIWLSFDNTKINATALGYNNYLNEPTLEWPTYIDNAHGYVTLARSSCYPASGKSGSSPPPLATIQFEAISVGISQMHLYDTRLVNDQAMPISHTTIDGTVQVIAEEGHDVAIIDLAPTLPGRTLAYRGSTPLNFKVNATVQNQGDFSETFNVTLYANTTEIGKQAVALANGITQSIVFVWTVPSSFPKGNCTLSAVADLSGDMDPSDNTFHDGIIRVVMAVDLNNDKKCNLSDLIKIAGKFGTKIGDSTYDPNYDINLDTKIDLSDLIKTAIYFGNQDP